MRPIPLRRTLVAMLAVFVALIGVLTLDPPSSSAAITSSSPVWVPLHTGFGVDCAGKNPGCTSKRDFYSIDIIPNGQFGADGSPSYARVYAMGAGVLHVGNAHGIACGHNNHSFGTWVSIDHGHGVFSRYGHLSKILVKNGTRVTAGTPIGVVGATGKAQNCGVHYLDFEIDHGKLSNDNAYRFGSLQACATNGHSQTWPAQAASTEAPGNTTPVHYTRWGNVPHGTQYPESTGSCI